MKQPRLSCARPSPGFDPLDDTEDDGAEQATEADMDDPISEKKRRKRPPAKPPKEQANGTHEA